MRRCLLLVPILALSAACASSPPKTAFGLEHPEVELPSRRPTVLSIPDMRTIYADAPTAAIDLVPAPASTVRLAIKKMLTELDIPITVDDAKYDVYGNNDFQKIHRIGNKPMSDFLDCGVTAMGARTATNRMYISLITVVDSMRPNSTRIRSTVEASARDLSAASSSRPLHCSSTGKLERMLIDSVVAMSKR